jgi:hypothetical protein
VWNTLCYDGSPLCERRVLYKLFTVIQIILRNGFILRNGLVLQNICQILFSRPHNPKSKGLRAIIYSYSNYFKEWIYFKEWVSVAKSLSNIIFKTP